MPSAAGPQRARLGRVDAGQRGAEEAAGLRLPPGVDDDRLALADALVVPAPDLGLDRLADRGHVLEVVVVLGGLVRADLAEHPDRGGRGVEDVHAELLGDPPRASGVRVVRGAFVQDAGGAERERAVDDVGVAGDPADVRHAPVRVVRVDVLVVLRRAGHVGEVAADGVLAALRAAGGAAGVHQEQRVGRLQRDRLDDLALVRGQQVVDEDVAALDHRRLGRVLAGVAAEDEHLVDLLAFLRRRFDRLVRLDLVVEQLAAAVVAVDRDQHGRAGVGDPVPGGGAGEPGEHLRVDDAEAGRGQHGDRKLGDHRHVEGDAVARLEPERLQHGRELVDPDVELTVGDGLVRLALRLGHPDQRGLVGLVGEVPVDAVVGGVQLPADKPLPKRRVGRVEHRVPRLEPGQQVRVGGEAVRELVLGELLADRRVGRVGLGDERGRGRVVAFVRPVHRDERLGGFRYLVVVGHVVEIVSHVYLLRVPALARLAAPILIALAPRVTHRGRNPNLTLWTGSHHGSMAQCAQCFGCAGYGAGGGISRGRWPAPGAARRSWRASGCGPPGRPRPSR